MWLLPIVALSSLCAVGYVASRPRISITNRVSGEEKAARQLLDNSPSLKKLLICIHRGQRPSDWLINEAICEAYDSGNWKIVRKIQRKFGKMDLEDKVVEKEDLDKEDRGEEEDRKEEGSSTMGVSPFDGIPDDAWSIFVGKLSTQKPDFENERHIGQYHHSKSRIAQLGFDVSGLKDPGKQYEALVADLKDSKSNSEGLISEYLVHPVKVGGTEHLITLSGIMGLLKAAGPQRAKSWLTNPEDREKFPHTTKMFVETNGIY